MGEHKNVTWSNIWQVWGRGKVVMAFVVKKWCSDMVKCEQAHCHGGLFGVHYFAMFSKPPSKNVKKH